MLRTIDERDIRLVSEDHMIAKCPKPPIDNEKRRKQSCFNEKVNCACKNSGNNSNQKIYAFMARMSDNDKCPSENVGDSLQLTNRILDYVSTCHKTQEFSDFIPGSLEDTRIKTLKLRTNITSQQNKKVKYKYKCTTITVRHSSQRYIMYF